MEETSTKRPPSAGAIALTMLLSVGAGFAIHQDLLGGDDPDAEMFTVLGAALVLFALLMFFVGFLDEMTDWSISHVTQPAAQTFAYLGAVFLTVQLGQLFDEGSEAHGAFQAVFLVWMLASSLLTLVFIVVFARSRWQR